LPPSEYGSYFNCKVGIFSDTFVKILFLDQSPLLLCQLDNPNTDQGAGLNSELGGPRCINPRNIQVFKGALFDV